AHERTALAGLHVLELHDPPRLPIELDVHAVAELVRRDDLGHRRGSLTPTRSRGRRCPPRTGSADRVQVLRKRRQQLEAVLTDDRQVLDADAADAREVDARLDGDDVPDLDRVGRLGRETRRLVDEQADAVPEAVAEAVAVA